ncbi:MULTISPECIES: PASTA domain-containing protein [unclassified Ruminococcus]|uniref:PASTA domain-containing protein n=1 Tax=unclassified Ruminococcus TaxID=2608920 RepID=UPI00210EFD6D|nr:MULTISPECIES: PASTA domain-containing protein [unclassified Ruminococcus]
MPELCYGCMKESCGKKICPNCGFDKNTQQKAPFLPLGKRLQDRYTVGKILVNSTDSATYIGYDEKENTVVNIREFLPAGLCTRDSGDDSLTPNNGSESVYSKYLEEFKTIYTKVKKFSELSAVTNILEVFEENNTVYAVEEVDDVIPFEEYIERSGDNMDWDNARPLFMPLLSALSQMNSDGVYHLGVSPDNLVVTSAGKIRLINFAINEVRQKGNKVADVLYSGCSAPEQYEEDGVIDEQTEIYGFTATLFYALAGKLPADAVKRKEDGRLLISTNVVKKLPPHVVSALANGLQVDKEQRITDFESMRAQLSAAPTVKAIQEEIARPAVVPMVEEDVEEKKGISNFAWGLIAAIIALIIFSALGFWWISTNPFEGMFQTAESPTDPTASTAVTEPQGEDFTYPKDSEFFRVPSFIGLKLEDAQKKAEESDGEYIVIRTIDDAFSDTVAEGFICEQSPEGRTTINRGKDGVTIAVTISKGSKTRTLPDIEKLSYEQALKALTNEHLLTDVVLEFSDDVPENAVISYKDNKKGDKVEYGSAVTIVVSLGPEPTSTSSSDTTSTSSEFTHSDAISFESASSSSSSSSAQ